MALPGVTQQRTLIKQKRSVSQLYVFFNVHFTDCDLKLSVKLKVGES